MMNKKNNYYELFYFFNRSNHGKIKIQTDKNLKNYLDIDSFLKSLSDILDKNILEHIVDIKENFILLSMGTLRYRNVK